MLDYSRLSNEELSAIVLLGGELRPGGRLTASPVAAAFIRSRASDPENSPPQAPEEGFFPPTAPILLGRPYSEAAETPYQTAPGRQPYKVRSPQASLAKSIADSLGPEELSDGRFSISKKGGYGMGAGVLGRTWIGTSRIEILDTLLPDRAFEVKLHEKVHQAVPSAGEGLVRQVTAELLRNMGVRASFHSDYATKDYGAII